MKKENIKFTFCHQMPERSFHFKGRQFPVCARCTGVFLGYLALPIFCLELVTPTIPFIIIFSAPLILDSVSQALGKRESNNALRLITGFLFGVSQVALIVLIGNLLTSLIMA
jgi:uncharacterized membrane protein